MDKLAQAISNFRSISLDEMNSVTLLNRMDTKYVFRIDRLYPVLKKAESSYEILDIDNTRIFQYNTLYYDGPNLNFYLDHHNGLRSRFKVRFREYVNNKLTYLELKEKNNKERTRKRRIKVDRIESGLSDGSKQYIKKFLSIDPDILKPTLWSRFSRITLVHRENKERITIDTDLSFEGYSKQVEVPSLVICELKQDKASNKSVLAVLLKESKIYPANMSKYSIGTVLLNPDAKYNRFKEKLLTLNKIIGGDVTGFYHIAS